jgi:aminopeptidase N
LIQHETNGFNQWQATQTLLERIFLEDHKVDTYIQAIKNTLLIVNKDPLLASRLFDVPSESYLGSRIDQDYEPELIREKREAVINRLARELGSFWKDTYLA